MKPTADRLVDSYLKRLNRELSDLSKARRRELTDEIAGHIADARAELDSENEVEIRNVLERLGDPSDIAAEERARSGLAARRAGPLEIVTLIGLLVGGYSEGCASEVDPVTGADINQVCTGGPSLAAQIVWIVVLAFCVIGPFFTTAFLAVRMKRPARAGYQPSPGSA